MEDKITDEDIAKLCAENPLASEQLRRIVAERQRDELKVELKNGNDNLPTGS